MGLGGEVLDWMDRTGFQGSFMDAWEAYGNGDDHHSSHDSQSDSETEPNEIIILRDSGPFAAGEVYFVAGESLGHDLPFKVRMRRGVCGLDADETWVTGLSEDGRWFLLENGRRFPSDPGLADLVWKKIQEHSTHCELELRGVPNRVAKSQHGDVWLEHDGLPFQVRILRTAYGLRAGDALWVTGISKCDSWLLLENGRQVPYHQHQADPSWTEIKATDMQQEDKRSLLVAIASCGSTQVWRDQFRDTAALRRAAPPRMTRVRGGAGARGMPCCQCGVTKAADAFSSTQRKLARALRRCKACTARRM